MSAPGGKYQICVSGAAKGVSVDQGHELAKQLGVALAQAGHSLLTGATTGLPEKVAQAYKQAGGQMSLGISPAATKVEHVLKYRLPTESYDAILYSGLHYVGRDALLISSADGVVSIGGRLGTLHEFTIALETHTPIALLQGAGGISSELPELIKALPNADPDLLMMNSDASQLVTTLTEHLDKLHQPYRDIYHD